MGEPQKKDPLDIRNHSGLRRVQPKPLATDNDENNTQASADAMKAQHAANEAAVEQTTPPAAPAQSEEPAMSEPKVKTPEEVIPIAKPAAKSGLDKFKSKRAAAVANVETLQTGLPHHKISAAKDFVRLHPDEERYWSPELCFVSVPIQGQKKDTLHLIDEDLAMEYLPSGRVQRFRLALATKPLRSSSSSPRCRPETRTISGTKATCWRASRRKRLWVQATSRKEEGVDAYKVDFAREQDAFPEPKWPTQSLDDMIDEDFRRPHDRQRGSSGVAAPDRRQAVAEMSEHFTTIVVCDFEYETVGGEHNLVAGDLPGSVHGGVRAGFESPARAHHQACGAANSAPRRRSTSGPTRCSSPIPLGRK